MQLVEYWRLLQNNHSAFSFSIDASLHFSTMLQRDDTSHDYRNISWNHFFNDQQSLYRLDIVAFEVAFETTQVNILWKLHRRFDVDDFVAHLKTLKILKENLSLSYISFYFQLVMNNSKMLIDEHKSHEIMHFRLKIDFNDRKWKYNIHVLFSHMKFSKSRHLKDATQRIWINQIILFAIRASVSINVRTRHFFNFEIVRVQTHNREKIHMYSADHLMNNFRLISINNLVEFWIQVVALIDEHNDFKEFVLIISEWNQKLHFQRQSLKKMRTTFINHFELRFRIFDEFMNEIWIDLEMKNVLFLHHVDLVVKNITLLWKSSCFEHWITLFHDKINVVRRVRNATYSFLLIRDVESCFVEMTFINILRTNDEQTFHKVYVMIRNYWFIFARNVHSFVNSYFENLSLVDEKFDRWHIVNRRNDLTFESVHNTFNDVQFASFKLKVHQFKTWRTIKHRIDISLIDAHQHFHTTSIETINDLRKKYRLRLSIFQELKFAHCFFEFDFWSSWNVSDSKTRISHFFVDENSFANLFRHRSYWILFKKKIDIFITITLNRYFLFIEIMIIQCHNDFNDLKLVFVDDQRQYNLMINAFLRILQLILSEILSITKNELWQNIVKRRVARQSHLFKIDWNSDSSDIKIVRQRELDYKNCIQKYDYFSLFANLIIWDFDFLFVFDFRFFFRLIFVVDVMQNRFKNCRDIVAIMIKQDRKFKLFRDRVEIFAHDYNDKDEIRNEHVREIMTTRIELIVQLYIQNVWNILKTRIIKHIKNHTQQRNESRRFMFRLSNEKIAKLQSLIYVLVVKLLDDVKSKIVYERSFKKYDSNNNKIDVFDQYYVNDKWIDRIRTLFEWNDFSRDKKRIWDKIRFRQFQSRLQFIIIFNWELRVDVAFQKILVVVVNMKFFCVSLFDCDHLFIEIKFNKNNNIQRVIEIVEQIELKRTNWFIVCFSVEQVFVYRKRTKMMHRLSLAHQAKIMQWVRWYILKERLKTITFKNSTFVFVRDSASLHLQSTLKCQHARNFQIDVTKTKKSKSIEINDRSKSSTNESDEKKNEKKKQKNAYFVTW